MLSILAWSFEDESFWRGKEVPLAEVVDKSRAMIQSRVPEDFERPHNCPLRLKGLIWPMASKGTPA